MKVKYLPVINRQKLFCLLLSAGTVVAGCSGQNQVQDTPAVSSTESKTADPLFRPGIVWADEAGEVINAHGGGVLQAGKVYYWFGEKRGKQASEGVNVYSSEDLYHWKYEGIALSPSQEENSDIAAGCLMERPKVIYNPKTKKYVMWFHLELKGQGYKAARAGVAISDKVTGPFRYVKSFRPNNNMSRDMTLFVDDNGKAYTIYSSRENYDLHIAELTDDFTSASAKDKMIFSAHREAPAIFKWAGRYYLITSGCTGWKPNAADLHIADSLFGEWTSLGSPLHGKGADSTYGGQSTYILPVAGKKDQFIFMADKWNPGNLTDSRYIWLPVQFKKGRPYIEWTDSWQLK